MAPYWGSYHVPCHTPLVGWVQSLSDTILYFCYNFLTIIRKIYLRKIYKFYEIIIFASH